MLDAGQLTELQATGNAPPPPSKPSAPLVAKAIKLAPLIELPSDLELEEIGASVPEPRATRPASQATHVPVAEPVRPACTQGFDYSPVAPLSKKSSGLAQGNSRRLPRWAWIAISGTAGITAVMVVLWVGEMYSFKTTRNAAAERISNAESGPWLSYAMKPGLNYHYEFTLTSDNNDKGPISGLVTYVLQESRRRAPTAILDGRAQLGGGTAFVVNDGGWLVTCSHVIRDATKIEAAIGNRTFIAKLVGSDDLNDISLLKIDASGLPSLPPASVALMAGDDASTVGFPLTAPNGDPPRVTSTRVVASFGDNHRHSFKLDPLPNPGSCGGPLLDAAGRVTGMLTAASLATALDPIQGLLARHNVVWQTGLSHRLSKSEFARAIQPCIVRLNLEIPPDVPFDDVEVRCFGSIVDEKGERKFDNVERVSTRGDVSEDSGQLGYSLLSTTIGRLPFAQLPLRGQRKWSVLRDRQDKEEHDARKRVPTVDVRDPKPPGLTGPFSAALNIDETSRPQPEIRQVAIEEQEDYELAELTDDKAIISTTLTSARTDQSSKKLLSQHSSSGQIVFDLKAGVIASGSSKMIVKVQKSGGEAVIPARISFKLKETVTTEELDARNEKIREDLEERSAKEKGAKAALDRKRLDNALTVLRQPDPTPNKSFDYTQVRNALEALRSLSSDLATDEERVEIRKFLDLYLSSPTKTIQREAIGAAKNWSTSEQIPALIKLLRMSDDFNRDDILLALGRTGGDEKTAIEVAKFLDTDGRWAAASALFQMPKYAELPTLRFLKSKNWVTRAYAFQVLEAVGGKESLAAFQTLQLTDGPDELRAKSARQKIERRLADQLDDASNSIQRSN